ncbi:MAG: VWA domain-containing protein [Candidatus Omnitrophica bacterium]|nr:VWA domain-containing protein [Candidatus Omnitrophota bacterium]
MEFKTPLILVLIPILLLFLVWERRRRQGAAFVFPSAGLLDGLQKTWRSRLEPLPFILRCLTLVLVVIALAGPRKPVENSRVVTEGVNIVLLLDTSTSMAAEDFTINGKRQNRLAVVKKVVSDFIAKRKDDRVGLVAFAARPYTVCPLTTDHVWLETQMDRIRFGLMEDGTAIGSAIASGANRLRNAEGKSKVMILLTDGINNAGKIEPLAAAKAAQSYGIRIYTIGAGTRGEAPYPVADMFGRTIYQNIKIEIDEDILRKIADTTGGQYFRATDTDSLEGIYDQIDRLEKTRIEETGYRQYTELFDRALVAALVLLVAEVLIGRTVLLRIP